MKIIYIFIELYKIMKIKKLLVFEFSNYLEDQEEQGPQQKNFLMFGKYHLYPNNLEERKREGGKGEI